MIAITAQDMPFLAPGPGCPVWGAGDVTPGILPRGAADVRVTAWRPIRQGRSRTPARFLTWLEDREWPHRLGATERNQEEGALDVDYDEARGIVGYGAIALDRTHGALEEYPGG